MTKGRLAASKVPAPASRPAVPTDACTRCRGTGFRDTPRAHWGVPGLCFDCDGAGSRAAQLAAWRRQAEAKAQEEKRRIAMAPVEAVRAEHGTTGTLPGRPSGEGGINRRIWAKGRESFTTDDYAAACSLTRRAAFIELSRTLTVTVVFEEATMTPIGWTAR